MKALLIVLAIVCSALALHLLALWMERKGWIYYTHNKARSSRLGNAFLEIQSILEPGKKHIIEVKDEIKKETQESGKNKGNPGRLKKKDGKRK